MQFCGELKHQLDLHEQQKHLFCNMFEEGEKLARQVQLSEKKEKEDEIKKKEFLRKNIRDGNKSVSHSIYSVITESLFIYSEFLLI